MVNLQGIGNGMTLDPPSKQWLMPVTNGFFRARCLNLSRANLQYRKAIQ
jgi:hypothetical protein